MYFYDNYLYTWDEMKKSYGGGEKTYFTSTWFIDTAERQHTSQKTYLSIAISVQWYDFDVT